MKDSFFLFFKTTTPAIIIWRNVQPFRRRAMVWCKAVRLCESRELFLFLSKRVQENSVVLYVSSCYMKALNNTLSTRSKLNTNWTAVCRKLQGLFQPLPLHLQSDSRRYPYVSESMIGLLLFKRPDISVRYYRYGQGRMMIKRSQPDYQGKNIFWENIVTQQDQTFVFFPFERRCSGQVIWKTLQWTGNLKENLVLESLRYISSELR